MRFILSTFAGVFVGVVFGAAVALAVTNARLTRELDETYSVLEDTRDLLSKCRRRAEIAERRAADWRNAEQVLEHYVNSIDPNK